MPQPSVEGPTAVLKTDIHTAPSPHPQEWQTFGVGISGSFRSGGQVLPETPPPPSEADALKKKRNLTPLPI